MLIAALDSATLTLSCALVDLTPGAAPRLHVRCERTEHAGTGKQGATGGHGARLPGVLSDLLVAEGLRLPDVDGYAIGLGPGSFTGLRIGLATWKGLAYANRRPCAGAESLMAMALAAARAAAAEDGALLVPLLDARKGEVYAGFYRRSGQGVARVAPDAALPPEALVARVAELGPARAFGEGYAAYEAAFAGRLPRLAAGPQTPGAAEVAALAAERLLGAAYDQQAVFALEPHYVRKSEAEVKFPNGLGPGVTK